jgi:hypothetical protein
MPNRTLAQLDSSRQRRSDAAKLDLVHLHDVGDNVAGDLVLAS